MLYIFENTSTLVVYEV